MTQLLHPRTTIHSIPPLQARQQSKSTEQSLLCFLHFIPTQKLRMHTIVTTTHWQRQLIRLEKRTTSKWLQLAHTHTYKGITSPKTITPYNAQISSDLQH